MQVVAHPASLWLPEVLLSLKVFGTSPPGIWRSPVRFPSWRICTVCAEHVRHNYAALFWSHATAASVLNITDSSPLGRCVKQCFSHKMAIRGWWCGDIYVSVTVASYPS